jgi:hypothetical protein
MHMWAYSQPTLYDINVKNYTLRRARTHSSYSNWDFHPLQKEKGNMKGDWDMRMETKQGRENEEMEGK